MDELRWILLLVGVLFLVALTAFETRRARRAAVPREPFPHFEHEPAREPQEAASGPQLGELPEDPVESAHLEGAAAEPIRAQRGGPLLHDLPQVSAVHVESPPNGASNGHAPADEPAVPEAYAVQEQDAVPSEGASSTPSAAPRVDWPPEGERRIVSVRVASSGEQRLSGRAIRQALAACGFVLGRYRIFHQPFDDGRVLLSCASLNKPGNFDPTSMDFQRYSGVSVFTVLPGPLPAAAALEHLLDAARDLAQRLQARLLDEHGQPLDAARVAALRAGLPGAGSMPGSAAGAAAGQAGI